MLSPEVAEARVEKRPIVALESTLVAHGMAWPDNFELAKDLEKIVREAGAVPAHIAVVDGRPCVGLSSAQLERIAHTAPPTELPATFRLEWWKFLGEGYLQKGDLNTAISMYEKAADMAPDGRQASLKLLVTELKFRKKPQSEVH